MERVSRLRGQPPDVPVGPGVGDGLEFWGASFVSDPSGVVLKRGSHDKEENLIVRCDPARIVL